MAAFSQRYFTSLEKNFRLYFRKSTLLNVNLKKVCLKTIGAFTLQFNINILKLNDHGISESTKKGGVSKGIERKNIKRPHIFFLSLSKVRFWFHIVKKLNSSFKYNNNFCNIISQLVFRLLIWNFSHHDERTCWSSAWRSWWKWDSSFCSGNVMFIVFF